MPDIADTPTLMARAQHARSLMIDMAASAVGCHLGGSLSAADILTVATARQAEGLGTQAVLSKGHAAAGLYAALYVNGQLDQDPSQSYGSVSGHFTGHPTHSVPGVLFPTGSLGHGAAYALGWAMSREMKAVSGQAIAIVGDGELQEGLTWETFQIAGARQLGRYVVVVDQNGGQNDGAVAEISPMRDLRSRFESFGFTVAVVDGHSIDQLDRAIPRQPASQPTAVIARTVKGKGVRAIEGDPKCHYVKISARMAKKWKESL